MDELISSSFTLQGRCGIVETLAWMFGEWGLKPRSSTNSLREIWNVCKNVALSNCHCFVGFKNQVLRAGDETWVQGTLAVRFLSCSMGYRFGNSSAFDKQ